MDSATRKGKGKLQKDKSHKEEAHILGKNLPKLLSPETVCVEGRLQAAQVRLKLVNSQFGNGA